MKQSKKLKVPDVAFWLNEAQSCEERQKLEVGQRNNYPFLVNYYEGIDKVDVNYPHVSTETRHMIIAEYFPNTNELISEIIYQNPDILVEATKPQSEEGTPIMKSALKYAFNKTDSLIENRVGLFDMLYAGYCAIEVDILPEKKEPDKKYGLSKENVADENIEPEKKGIFDKLFGKSNNEEDSEKNLAASSPAMETAFSTVHGLYIRRYDPLDVPLDWRAARIRERRYNLKKVWMSYAEFCVRYPDYKDKVSSSQKFDYSKHQMSQHDRMIMFYEFQVRLKGYKYITFVISPSVHTEEIDYFERPYVTNNFNMKIGSLNQYGKLYPISFAQVNKLLNDEMNHYVRHLMDVAERNIPKYIADETKVKEDAQDALKSTRVNDIALIKGGVENAIKPLQPSSASLENKELLSIFQDQKNKLWSVSESRISGRAKAKFATDLVIQEQGFDSRQIDIQEGLRLLMVEEIDTMKDIIAKYWDGEVFLKVTGKEKVNWYDPVMVENPYRPGEKMALEPLTDILTGDYEISIDIASAKRVNRDEQLNRMVFFMQQLVQMRQVLVEQGKDINLEEIRRVSKEFGWNPDVLFIQHNPATVPSVQTVGGEVISPEEDAKRQQMAEQMAGGVNAQLPV